MRVVITDHRFPDVEQERCAVEASGGELVVAQTVDEHGLTELCKDADGVLTVRAPITKCVIAAMERCRIIVRYGIGVDTIDIPAATERGIMVANVPDYCIDEVSDHALALLLMLSRQMIPAISLAQEERWTITKMPPLHRLRGQTCGLAGCGKIGSLLAGKAAALGMRILIRDPYLSESRCREMGAELVSLDALLARSDFISLHMPLNEERDAPSLRRNIVREDEEHRLHHQHGARRIDRRSCASRGARFRKDFRCGSRCDGIGNGVHTNGQCAGASSQSDRNAPHGLA